MASSRTVPKDVLRWIRVKERNAAQATIHWRFNTQDARTKLHRLYPSDFTVD